MTSLARRISVSALALSLALPPLGPVFAQDTAAPSDTKPAETTTPAEAEAERKVGAAQSQPATAETTTPAEAEAERKVEAAQSQIESFTLDNGLQVVVLPDRRAPVVTQMIYYKVGSADEPPGESGIAHFLEHLMFKGTSTYPEGEFSRRVADIGGQENAFTSYDYTGYYQQVPADALEMVMTYEADRMENLVLSEEAVLPERDVILEERRMRIDNDPGSQLSEAVQAALFQNSPYGTPVIGWRSEMEELSREDAIRFYDRYYTPNNATLLIAGDVTVDQVRELAEKTYGQVKRRAEAPERVRPEEPEPLAERTVTLTDPRVTQPSLQTLYLVPSENTAPEGEAEALDILADVLGGGTTSRLYRSLVVDEAIAAGAGAYYSGTALDEGQFVLYGTPRGDATIEAIEAAIDAEVASIIENGITEEELERAKNRVRKNLIYLRDSQTAQARRYGAALSTGGTIEDVREWPERIEAVTLEDVQAVARKYLQPERSVTGYLKPEPVVAQPAAAETAGDATETRS